MHKNPHKKKSKTKLAITIEHFYRINGKQKSTEIRIKFVSCTFDSLSFVIYLLLTHYTKYETINNNNDKWIGALLYIEYFFTIHMFSLHINKHRFERPKQKTYSHTNTNRKSNFTIFIKPDEIRTIIIVDYWNQTKKLFANILSNEKENALLALVYWEQKLLHPLK